MQAIWSPVGKTGKKLMCCCTQCGIEGEIVQRCRAKNNVGEQCARPDGHRESHTVLVDSSASTFLARQEDKG